MGNESYETPGRSEVKIRTVPRAQNIIKTPVPIDNRLVERGPYQNYLK